MILQEKSRPGQLEKRVEQLRIELKRVAGQILALRSGSRYDHKENQIRIKLFDREIIVPCADLIAREAGDSEILPVHLQALCLYYLITSDGTPLEGRWIAFAELPDGRFYNQAFQGYTGNELVAKFGTSIEGFRQASKQICGEQIAYGDEGFVFQALPRVPVAAIYHLGDDEFPSTCKLLFDASASHYLPTDVCAILGSMLTRRLLLLSA